MEVFAQHQNLLITPEMTIGQLKQYILNNGFDPSKTKLYFNNNTQLSPLVFESNQYDTTNFQAQAQILKGSKLILTPSTILPVIAPNQNAYLIKDEEERDNVVAVYSSLDEAIKHIYRRLKGKRAPTKKFINKTIESAKKTWMGGVVYTPPDSYMYIDQMPISNNAEDNDD